MFEEELTGMIAKLKEKDFKGAAEILGPIIEKKAADIIATQFNGPVISQDKLNSQDAEADTEDEAT